MFLLEAMWQPTAPVYLRSLPAVETLRQCWISQFWMDHDVLHWRHAGNLPPSPARIDSPYDLDAHYGVQDELAKTAAAITRPSPECGAAGSLSKRSK
jgi:transposase